MITLLCIFMFYSHNVFLSFFVYSKGANDRLVLVYNESYFSFIIVDGDGILRGPEVPNAVPNSS